MDNNLPTENAGRPDTPREIPQPVRLSLSVIETIRQEGKAGHELLDQLKKALPVLAMKMAQNGEEITPALLKSYADRGPAHIKSLCESFNRPAAAKVQKSWPEIEKAVRRRTIEERLKQEDLNPSHLVSYLAAIGDAPSFIKALNELRNNLPHTYALQMDSEDHPLFSAATWGNTPVIKAIITDILIPQDTLNEAMRRAAVAGQTAAIEMLDRYCTIKPEGFNHAICCAAGNGKIESATFLLKNKTIPTDFLYKAATLAVKNNDLEMLKLIESKIPPKDIPAMHKNVAKHSLNDLDSTELYRHLAQDYSFTKKENQSILNRAIVKENVELAQHLIGNGVAFERSRDSVLQTAAIFNQPEIIKIAVRKTNPDQNDLDEALENAANGCGIESVHALIKLGADTTKLSEWQQTAYKKARKNLNAWDKHHGEAPKGLGYHDPQLHRPLEFSILHSILKNKTPKRWQFNAIALFQTAGRVIDYIEKFSESLNETNVIANLEIPDIDPARLKIWGDAIFKHGPKMAKLLRYAAKFDGPEKSADGKDWSYTATLRKAALYMYNGGKKYPELAVFCAEHKIDSSNFLLAAKVVTQFKKRLAANDNTEKPNSAIPDINVPGTAFGMKGYSFSKLPSGDLRGLFLGEMTNCCQSIGQAGHMSARHGFLSPNGGFYVVANDASGEIVGETWAWRGKKGEVVFDSLETLGRRVSLESWQAICKEAAKAFAENANDVTALYVGNSGGTPKLLPACADKSARPRTRLGYTDAYIQYEIWKRNTPKA